MNKGVNKVFIVGNLGQDPEVDALFFRWCNKVTVNKDTGCWEWNGANHNGYGLLSQGWKKTPYKAHRLAVLFATGTQPNGHVLHLCDNPSCVNPEHLMVGDQKENMKQASERGRLNPISTLNLCPGEKGIYGAGSKSNLEIQNATRSK